MSDFEKDDYIARCLHNGRIAYIARVTNSYSLISVRVLTILIPGIAPPGTTKPLLSLCKKITEAEAMFYVIQNGVLNASE